MNSRSEEVVECTVKLIKRMAFDLDDQGLWEWFSSNGILGASLEMLKTRADLFHILSEMILSYAKDHLVELFSEYFKETFSQDMQYWEYLTSFLPTITQSEDFKQRTESFIQDKVDEIIRDFESYSSDQIRSITCTFLFEIWTSWEEILTEELSQDILNLLKYMARVPEKAVQFTAISQMFRLLEMFTTNKNSAAPLLYKALIFILIDNHFDDTTRQYLMTNFMQIFETSDTIPVGILLEPLIKQFMESFGTTYKYNTFDFEFFATVAKHPRMKLNDAIPLMDVLAKIYLNDNVFCFAASVPFILIVNRFIEFPILRGYVKKFITLALSTLLTNNDQNQNAPESQRSKRRKPLPLPPSRSRKSAVEKHKPMNKIAIDAKLKKIAVIEICKKLISVQNLEINELIENLCLSIIVQLGK
jgi:hypothetical protein